MKSLVCYMMMHDLKISDRFTDKDRDEIGGFIKANEKEWGKRIPLAVDELVDAYGKYSQVKKILNEFNDDLQASVNKGAFPPGWEKKEGFAGRLFMLASVIVAWPAFVKVYPAQATMTNPMTKAIQKAEKRLFEFMVVHSGYWQMLFPSRLGVKNEKQNL